MINIINLVKPNGPYQILEEGKWFWFDDTTGRRHGPFETEKDAELDMEQTLRG